MSFVLFICAFPLPVHCAYIDWSTLLTYSRDSKLKMMDVRMMSAGSPKYLQQFEHDELRNGLNYSQARMR